MHNFRHRFSRANTVDELQYYYNSFHRLCNKAYSGRRTSFFRILDRVLSDRETVAVTLNYNIVLSIFDLSFRASR